VTSAISSRLLRAGLASLIAVPPAHAAEWSVVESASTAGGADVNPGLQVKDDGTRTSFAVDANAQVTRSTEATELTLLPVLHLVRYPGVEQLDGERASLDVGYSLTRARWSLGLTTAATRESTLTSELGTTGLTDVHAHRDTISVTAAPQWVQSERLSAGADLTYLRTAYPDAGNTDLYGSTYSNASLDASYRLSPTTSVALGVSGGRFDSDRPDGSSDSRQVTASFNTTIFEWISFTASGGPSWVAARHSTDRGLAYTLGIVGSLPRSTLTVSTSSVLSPIGYGVLTRSEGWNLSWAWRFTERTELHATYNSARTRDVLSELGLEFSEARYWHAGAGVRQRLSEQWSVSAELGESSQQQLPAREYAHGHVAYLSINWSARPRVF